MTLTKCQATVAPADLTDEKIRKTVIPSGSGIAVSDKKINALTIDVEDYFQVTAFEKTVSRKQWDDYPSRVVANTRKLLELFADKQVFGTFFVLGWVAERFPDLIREIDDAGHEIGSHGYWHRLVYEQTPKEFREDLRRSKCVIENIIGEPVTCYRAPTFSIVERTKWALEILVEEGFTIDSSIFPVKHHDRYGMPDIRPDIHQIETPVGRIWETPLSVGQYLGMPLPASGGGYFRLYPYALTRKLFHSVHSAQRSVIFYIHPWEIDPDQPRMKNISRTTRFRHYVNISRTMDKLKCLFANFAFAPLGQLVADQANNDPVVIPTPHTSRRLKQVENC